MPGKTLHSHPLSAITMAVTCSQRTRFAREPINRQREKINGSSLFRVQIRSLQMQPCILQRPEPVAMTWGLNSKPPPTQAQSPQPGSVRQRPAHKHRVKVSDAGITIRAYFETNPKAIEGYHYCRYWRFNQPFGGLDHVTPSKVSECLTKPANPEHCGDFPRINAKLSKALTMYVAP